MKRIFVPTCGLSDWRNRLADPEVQWERRASAFETAVSWELATKTERGLPPKVVNLLDSQPELRGARLIAALPEHKVSLPGGSRASQNDVWALLATENGLVSLAVEGKAGEPFGETLGDWLKEASPGKRKRLEYLMETLGVRTEPPSSVRYQLLHRTASAVLEARRCGALHAVMIVQSFRDDQTSEKDFTAFSELLGQTVHPNELKKVTSLGPQVLYLGWAKCDPASDAEIALAAV